MSDIGAFVRRRVRCDLLGQRFTCITASSLFSADRVDAGTRLLVDTLPRALPARILDIGCGWGAIGLACALAAREASVSLVDREVLAVRVARHNAQALGLANVSVVPSVGATALAGESFDLVLCNVPARIGARGIAHLVESAALCWSRGGQARIVVIAELSDTIEQLAGKRGWRAETCGSSAKHRVFAITQVSHAPASLLEAYTHAKLEVAGNALRRPTDIDESEELRRDGWLLLIECLPRTLSGSALCLAGGYGALALALLQRGAGVIAVDRDLLALQFTAYNTAAAGFRVATHALLWPDELPAADSFDMCAGYLPASLAPAAARELIARSRSRAARGWWLTTRRLAAQADLAAIPIAQRGRFVVLHAQSAARG